jgi:predicted HicB family RNase H-like nuclease
VFAGTAQVPHIHCHPGRALNGRTGRSGVIEYDAETDIFTGNVVGLRDVIYFEGASVEDLKASMHRAVDHYLDVCRPRR